jgi:hypothetical protein
MKKSRRILSLSTVAFLSLSMMTGCGESSSIVSSSVASSFSTSSSSVADSSSVASSVSSSAASSSSSSSSSEDPIVPGKTSVKLTGETGVEIGKTTTLQATVYGPNAKVTWSVDDPTLATVDQNGVVTGVKAGFVTITATSVLSTDDEPLTAALTLFVEPTYIARMVEGFRSYDLTNGSAFSGNIALSMKGFGLDTTLPYNLSLKTNADSYSRDDYVGGTLADFAVLPDNPAITFPMLVQLISAVDGGNFTAGSSLHVDALGDGKVNIFAYDTSADPLIGAYAKVDPAASFASSLVPALPLFLQMLQGAQSSGTSTAFSTIGSILNTFLTFNTTASEGISVNAAALGMIQSEIASLVTSNPVLGMILPTNLQDIRFTVALKDDGTFDTLALTVKDQTVPDSGDPETYQYLGITSGRTATTLATDYFDTIIAKTTQANIDVNLLTSLTTNYDNLTSSLDAFSGDYNTINFDYGFKTPLQSYIKWSLPTLSKIVNTPLIPTDDKTSKPMTYQVGPYEAFSVSHASDINANPIWSEYSAVAGETFTLSAVTPYGGSLKAFTDPITTFTVQTYDNANSVYKDVSDYVSISGNTMTVNKLPTDAPMIVEIAPSAVDGYVPSTFKLILTKAILS